MALPTYNPSGENKNTSSSGVTSRLPVYNPIDTNPITPSVKSVTTPTQTKTSLFDKIGSGISSFWNELTKVPTAEEMQKVKVIQDQAKINDPINKWEKQREIKKQYEESIKDRPMQTVEYTDPITGNLISKQLPISKITQDTRLNTEEAKQKVEELNKKSVDLDTKKKELDLIKVDERDRNSVDEYNNKVKLFNEELNKIQQEHTKLSNILNKGIIPEGPSPKEQILGQQSYLENKLLHNKDINLIKKTNLLMNKTSYGVERGLGDFSIGVAESTKSTIDGLQWVSDAVFSKVLGEDIKSNNILSHKLEAWSQAIQEDVNITDSNKTFVDSLLQGAGSAASFFLPGIGIMKGSSFFARYSPKIASWIANTTSSGLESIAEAGSVYEEVYSKTGDRNKAGNAATKVFWTNMLVLMITNKTGGYFDKSKRTFIEKRLWNASSEGLQETVQQMVSNDATGKHLFEGAKESGTIGSILGLVMGILGSPIVRERYKTEEERKTKEIPNLIPPPDGGSPEIKMIEEAITKQRSKIEQVKKEPKDTKIGKAIDITPNMRESIAEDIRVYGPTEVYNTLKIDFGMDRSTAQEVIKNVMDQETLKQAPIEDAGKTASDVADKIEQQALNEAGMAQEEVKTEETIQTLKDTDLISHEGAPELKTVEQYKKDILAGKEIEPLLVIKEGDKYGIEDGKHRYQAYLELGIKDIPVKIIQQPEAKMKISGETKQIIDKENEYISKNIDRAINLAVRYRNKKGKIDTETFGILSEISDKIEKKEKLTDEDRRNFKESVKIIGGEEQFITKGLDTLKTKEDNKEYGTNRKITKGTDGAIQPNREGVRGGYEYTSMGLLEKGQKRESTNIRKNDRNGNEIPSKILLGAKKSETEIRQVISDYIPKATIETTNKIISYYTRLDEAGYSLTLNKENISDYAYIKYDGEGKYTLTLNENDINELTTNTLDHEIGTHIYYSNIGNDSRLDIFDGVKEVYKTNKELFDKFGVWYQEQYWDRFIQKHLTFALFEVNPGTHEEIYKILRETGFIDENNKTIYPEDIMKTTFNFSELNDKLNTYLKQNNYNTTNRTIEQNNMMAEEIVAYVTENAEEFLPYTTGKLKTYLSGIVKDNLEFPTPNPMDSGLNDIFSKLKESTNLTAKDIIKKHPDIELKRDITITDVYGNKAVLKQGEGITPYEMTGNKYILQDGEAFLVSKSQAENVMNNSIKSEAKEFAPELKQTEETIGGENISIGLSEDARNVLKEVDYLGFDSQSQMLSALKNSPLSNFDIPKEILPEIKKWKEHNLKFKPTKYSQYTLPDGKNYKEILIKAPETNLPTVIEKRPGLLQDADVNGRIPLTVDVPVTRKAPTFKSSHWDEPNVIAHIRMNEREYNGKKVAFMEELQSDWAREARAKGTIPENPMTSLPEGYYLEQQADGVVTVFSPNREEISRGSTFQEARNNALLKLNTYGKITNNPLLKNWQELAIKRALIEAVDTNAKYFAWINGTQTEARYNLSKELDSIDWKIMKDEYSKEINLNTKVAGKITLILDGDGKIKNAVGGKPEWIGKPLEDAIGKGVAEKILTEKTGELEGTEMDVKATWAYKLYDDQVKNIVKNLTGAEVKTLDMGLPVDKEKISFLIQKETPSGTLNTGKKLTKDNMEVGMIIFDKQDYVITDILGDGKFKAVPKKSFNDRPFPGIKNNKINNKYYSQDSEETFDISTKQATQQGIELTPEIKSIIKGEARQIAKPSGKLPFEEQITAPVMFKLKPKSNLTEEQQRIVRTQEFKNWFGDWENDPQNASKIVDENGEPLVVYHGTQDVFEEFMPSGKDGFPNAVYFTNNKNIAKTYAGFITDNKIMKVFLNIKDPYISNAYGNDFNQYYSQMISDLNYAKDNNDGAIIENIKDDSIQIKPKLIGNTYVAFEPNQIKSATGNTTFGETGNIFFKLKQPTLEELKKNLENTQKDLDKAVANPEVYGQNSIVNLNQKVADLRKQIIEAKYPKFESENIIEDMKETIDFTKERVNLVKKMTIQENNDIVDTIIKEGDISKEEKEKLIRKNDILNLYNNSLTEPLIELPDNIKKIHQEFVQNMELLEYNKQLIKEHPGAILRRFENPKTGRFEDFKNPDLIKNKSQKQAVIERNKKVMRVSENAFEGTNLADQFDNPDIIREQIEEYKELRKKIDIDESKIKEIASRYFKLTDEFYNNEKENLGAIMAYNQFELGLEMEATTEIETGVENSIYDEITNRAKYSGLTALKNSKHYKKDFFRIMERVFGKGYPMVYNNFIKPFEKSKGDNARYEIKLKNELHDEIVKKFNIKPGSIESRAVMDYGERNLQGEFAPETPETKESLVGKFGGKKAQNIIDADTWFREKYNTLIDEVNAVYKEVYGAVWAKKENLDMEIQLLQENIRVQKIKMAQTKNKNTLQYLSYVRSLKRMYGMVQQRVDLTNSEVWWRGKMIPKRNDYYRHYQEISQGFVALKNIIEQEANIPTNLAAISQNTKPKSKFLQFGKERTGNKTRRDAVGAFQNYIPAATYAIHITPHIERFRKMTEALIRSDNKIYSPLITYLTKYTDALAGKTGLFDRDLQEVLGRKTFRAVDWLNKRVKANVIMGNPRVSIVQLASLIPGFASAKQYAITGIKRYMVDRNNPSSPMTKSNFLVERYKDVIDEKFSTGIAETPLKLARIMMRALEKPSVEIVWNSHYDQGVAKKVADPIAYADTKTRNIVAGRGIGEMPLVYNSKTIQFFAPFQLEVGNLWSVLGDFKREKDIMGIALFVILSYLFNRGVEEITGSDIMPDPIQASLEGTKAFLEEEDKLKGAGLFAGRLGGEVLSNIPFGQYGAALYPEYGLSWLGSIPRAELFGKGDPTRYGTGLLAFSSLTDPLFKILPPFGGSQIKKTYQGVQSYIDGKVTNKAGDTLYNVPQDTLKLTQMALFGKYSVSESKKYFDRKEITDQLYTDKLKEWEQIPHNSKNLTNMEKEIAEEVYGKTYSTTQLNTVAKKFATYRTFGEDNKIVNKILDAKNNEDKVDILIEYRNDLIKEKGEQEGMAEFKKFWLAATKKFESRTSKGSSPLLLSDDLQEFYFLKRYLDKKMVDNKIDKKKYTEYLQYYKAGRISFKKIKSELGM